MHIHERWGQGVTGLSALLLACGLAGQTDLLAAIVRVESGGNPFALSVNGAFKLVRSPRDRHDATAMARWLQAHGYNFDAGLAQVNSANLERLGLDAETVFEPCANLRAAGVILDECLDRARARGFEGRRAVAAALSCYNTGHLSRGVRNGYVGAVRAALDRVARRAFSATAPSFPSAARRSEAFALASTDVFDARGDPRRAPSLLTTPQPGGNR
jgi:type IV secretion system protein VirB1